MGNDSQSDALRWTTQIRRAFIEHRLFWRARIGLADLMDTFGMSRTQSSQDLNAYISEFPDHLSCDKSARTYVPGPKFKAHYGPLDGDAHLSKLLAMAEGAMSHTQIGKSSSRICWHRPSRRAAQSPRSHVLFCTQLNRAGR